MLKLYRKIDAKIEYWETWDANKKIGIIHWGVVGERGQDKELKGSFFNDFHKVIQSEIDKMIQQGFAPVEDENIHRLIIEYKIEDQGSESDLKKIQKLEERMNETLGWTGLGSCDGNSIGSGTMEVCCFVVDFKIGKRVIENDLRSTEFENYSRIYDEDE